MALRQLKEKVIKLRKRGLSYNQIKKELGVSKSTLSGWLKDYPLSKKRLKELQTYSEKRIEQFRVTMAKRREDRLSSVYKQARKDIGKLTSREIFLAGIFLYWGEGAKNQRATVSLSNTDPSVIRFFIKWLLNIGVKKEKFTVTLHLYKDMNVSREINFWSREIKLPKSAFRKPYIKHSNLIDITYRNGFNHGTCMLRIFSRDFSERVLMGIKYLQEELSSL